MTITLHPLPEHIEWFDNFFPHYELIDHYRPPTDKPNTLSPASKRICRFCNGRRPEVRFKTRSHLIPQNIGNKYGLSDFECDSCNAFFSPLESALSYYLGLYQGLDFKRPRKLRSNLATFSHEILHDQSIIKIMANEEGEGIERIGNEVHITYNRSGFVPQNIYKAFLKMALSILPKDEVDNYGIAFDYLMNRDKLSLSRFQNICITEFPLQIQTPLPFIYLFKKKNTDIAYPTHQVSVYFHNKIFSFPIPFHKNEMNIYNADGKCPVAPPLSSIQFKKGERQSHSTMEDFSSNITVKNSLQKLVIADNLDPDKEMAAFHPRTGEITSGILNEGIRTIIIGTGNTRFNIEKAWNQVDLDILYRRP